MIKLFVRKIENIDEAEKQRIIASLSNSARIRLERKQNDHLALSSLCALSLLSDLERTDLDYTEGGRPFFKSLDADLSISHSHTYAAVAISDKKNERVGIDVEGLDIKTELALRFFTDNERRQCEIGTHPCEIWTKKEALFKYLKNDGVSFISLDSTNPQSYQAGFFSLLSDSALITVCTAVDSEIEII